MTEPKLKIDELIIDELVCGNLEGDRYREVLRALDAQPERWRECALAFLQEQAIAKEMKAMAKVGFATADSNESEPTISTSDAALSGVRLSRSDALLHTEADRSFSRLQWMHRMTSIAALLLISFSVGWYGSGILGGNQGNASASASSQQLGGSLSGDLPPAAGDGTPRSDVIRGNDLQFASDSLVELDREMPEWLREMERRGQVRIDSFDALMPLQLDDGTSAVVPVQEYRIRPTTRTY